MDRMYSVIYRPVRYRLDDAYSSQIGRKQVVGDHIKRMVMEQLPGEPIIVAGLSEGADSDSASNLYRQISDLANRWSDLVFILYGIKQFRTSGVGQMLEVLSQAAANTSEASDIAMSRSDILGKTSTMAWLHS